MERSSSSTTLLPSERLSSNEIGRCDREIAEIELLILCGHPDLRGLCLALSDWSAELRILQNERRRQGA
jgi:hypothetical protein